MSHDADTAPEGKVELARAKVKNKDGSWQWFTTPQPIKRLFDKFPLQTYAANELPQRTAAHRDQHTLYIFTTEEGAKDGALSFNPGCLKWQAWLRFTGVEFVTIRSNNHASPTGALPFLLPSASSPISHTEAATPVPSNRIQRWTREVKSKKGSLNKPPSRGNRDEEEQMEARSGTAVASKGKPAREDPADMRYEAYMSLLDHRIRNAYLYSLYLSPPNFASIATPLYINSSSTIFLVRQTLSHQLRVAAESELLKQSPTVDIEAVYRDCDKAFEALSELLGEDEFFFGERRPGLLDASVLAYTNVLLSEELDWRDPRMKEQLRGYQNLVEHRERIADGYFH